ncbi:putative non-specific serine/threonine protein kinase [Medicago truncatula]|uniref:Putative non-specific serine/threonine protein kinase n=1 Tax=Medicago truncatula TaxID=3880 RepID=A0A396HY86_MEDTR|nr:putative non-specific serine/threonine protein kinase [Medicago truncatula]
MEAFRRVCDITNIQLVDLSENNPSGRIFKCLKNFSVMSQNVSPNRTIVFVFVYYKGTLVYEGYDFFALLMWKGNIPEEIGNLIELVSLNLSNNNLNGEITSKIGRLTSLEFLDLSRNHFSGLIPPSLAKIDCLSLLNLLDNNRSGRIPIGTQLQSFNASNYEGNVDLCEKPLDKKCLGGPRNQKHQKKVVQKIKNQFI